MADQMINDLADRLGRLTVVNLVGGEAGPLERYVRRSALVELAEDILAAVGRPRWPLDYVALGAIIGELRHARKTHGLFPTLHHALGVVREEYKKFEEKVFERDVDRGAVSIARRDPWYFHGPSYPPLFPPEDLLRDYNDGLVAWKEYEDRYYCTILGPLDVRRVFDELTALTSPHEPVVLCWELPDVANPEDARCHRRTFARWMEDGLHIVVPEICVADAMCAGTNEGPLFRK